MDYTSLHFCSALVSIHKLTNTNVAFIFCAIQSSATQIMYFRNELVFFLSRRFLCNIKDFKNCECCLAFCLMTDKKKEYLTIPRQNRSHWSEANACSIREQEEEKTVVPQIRGLRKKKTKKKCKLLSKDGRNQATSYITGEQKEMPTHFYSRSLCFARLYLFFRLFLFSHRIPQYLHSSCEVFCCCSFSPSVYSKETKKLSTKKRHKHQGNNIGPFPEWPFLLFHLLLLAFWLLSWTEFSSWLKKNKRIYCRIEQYKARAWRSETAVKLMLLIFLLSTIIQQAHTQKLNRVRFFSLAKKIRVVLFSFTFHGFGCWFMSAHFYLMR